MKTDQPAAVKNYFCGKHVLVTGGFGFIGSHTAKVLLECGATVTVTDLDTSAQRDCLINSDTYGLRSKVDVVEGDMRDMTFVSQLVRDGAFDVIYHFAAVAVIENALADPLRAINTNLLGWVHLLEAARGLKEKPAAMVLASTDKVYGEIDTEDCDEQAALRGVGMYEAAKMSADVFSRTYFQSFGLPTVVLRLCNVFGPNDMNIDRRLIPKAMKALYANTAPEAPQLYAGSRGHGRDYAYIDDVVRAFLLLGENPNAVSNAFNMSACVHLTTPEVLDKVVEIAARAEFGSDRRRAMKIADNGVYVVDQAQAEKLITISRHYLDGAKLRSTTGFSTKTSFDEGLQLTVEWYREHFCRQRARQQKLNSELRTGTG